MHNDVYENCQEKICPASFRESCQWLKVPLNGLRNQSRVSPAVGLLPLASGPACLGMTFPPFLVKQLYRCDSVVISSFVRTGYTTGRWGRMLGRIGYSITHHYPLYAFQSCYVSETWAAKASDARRITAAEMKYMRRKAGYTWTDCKTNAQIAKVKVTPILDKLLEYKRSWIQHVNRMSRNRLPRVMKYYCQTGRRNHGRLLDMWDRNGSTSCPTAWQIYDDDDVDDGDNPNSYYS